MPVIVNMACGLANRMFQYSYYLYLKKLGYDAYVDFYTSAKLRHEKVSWSSIFPDAPIRQAPAMDVLKTGGGSSLVSRIRRRYLWRTCRVRYMSSAFDASPPDENSRLLYISGVFQNAEMVSAVESEVLSAFSFRPFADAYNRAVSEEILSCESVAVHVRKGKDYVERHWYTGTCSAEYYSRAVDLLKGRVENPRFYVFTDNPQWVKENFTGFEYTLVRGNPVSGPGSHCDMQLMSLCRHNIISNSTYSWWAAFLNSHKDKTVVIPEKWFNPEAAAEYRSDKLCCQGWISI